MARNLHSIVVWIANLLVPGAGLVLVGSMLTGALAAAVWGLAVTGLLVGTIWPALVWPNLRYGLAVAAVAIYIGMQMALYVERRKAGRRLSDSSRDEKFKTILMAYLEGRYDEAEAQCRQLLREDPDDVEACLQLATIDRRRGRLAAAQRGFRRAWYLDTAGKWDNEISRELASLVPSAGGPGRPGTA
jgi:tetratricopeptide (TPR) repeat protein